MDDHWLYREGKRAGRPYTASLRIPFDPARWPEYDHHVALVLSYGANWRDGLPKPAELRRLQDLEDRIIDTLEGHGALVATETTAGTRTIHLYIRGGGALAEGFGRRQNASVAHDPAWERVAHLSTGAARRAAGYQPGMTDVDRSDHDNNVASKCDGDGHRIFVTSNENPAPSNMVVIDDRSCAQ